MASPQFACKHCRRPFVRERAFLEHKCSHMKRQEEIQTPTGQAALYYYQLWFTCMKKIPPNAGTFVTSHYYRTFVNLVAFFQRVNITKPDKFIWLMVEKKYPPTMWAIDAAYASYMDFLEHGVLPMEQVNTSIDTLFSLAEARNIDVSSVFDVIHPNDIIHMIRTRSLSPWLLLTSKKFKGFFINKATPEQQQIMETLIRPDTWSQRFVKNKPLVEKIKLCVAELGV